MKKSGTGTHFSPRNSVSRVSYIPSLLHNHPHSYIHTFTYAVPAGHGRSKRPPSAPPEIEEYFHFLSVHKSLAVAQAISHLFLSTEYWVAIPVHSVSGRTGKEKVAMTQGFSQNTSVFPCPHSHILTFILSVLSKE
jgi:hypothetical protein